MKTSRCQWFVIGVIVGQLTGALILFAGGPLIGCLACISLVAWLWACEMAVFGHDPYSETDLPVTRTGPGGDFTRDWE